MMERRVYGSLVAAPLIAAGCYLFYQYKSRKLLYILLNLPDSNVFFIGGFFTRVRNFIHRNTMQDRLWNYVKTRSEEGNAESVLAAFDDYCYNYEWSWSIGDKKAAILTKVVQEAAPMVALECGTFCGYSAVVIALNMPSDGRLITIEANPKSAEMARKIINQAGFGEKVTVVTGFSHDIIPDLHSKYGVETVDLIFLDHKSKCYVPDLQRIEKGGFLHPGSTVFADNVKGIASTGDFSPYIRNSGNYECQFYDATQEYTNAGIDGMERGIYKGADV